ncbi:molybdopterin-dependent oxidoreductase [Gordonia amicalis]|uniref:molybdopterin-dependent oxidoreductase n=1 Tax=Gordonia amicalis TaxID=89053 RepID=UPI002953A2C3|nr:molybdopterin-dependent oxidoreductase [Gordonia amicalis]MDV7173170.1 molybdopterin-dependent oxidoreductase [Gordonia amicalis]
MVRVFRESTVRAAVSGVVAVAGGLAVGELVAVSVSQFASPYRAVAAFLVDHAPAFAREFAIDRFGTADKPVLLAGMALVILLIAVTAGVLQVKRPPVGVLIVVAFAAVGVAAALTRPTVEVSYVVPPVAAGLVAVGVLVVLGRGSAVGNVSEEDASRSGGWSRRQFVGAVGIVVVTGAVCAGLARRAADTGGALAERVRLRLPRTTSASRPVPPGTELRIDGATPFMTGNREFYRIDTALQVPQLTTTDWRLRIHGMVDREMTLRWDDLQSMPAIERIITLTCVSNEVGGDLAGNARWLGYSMRDILAEVGVHADADMLLATSVDGWTSGSPLEAIRDGRDALLAVGMNGEPLPLEHGYPVRQLIPGLYGYVSACKWVVDWEITRFDRAEAYWTQRGWGERGPIKTASRIDRPAPLSTTPAGPVVVAGTVWAQHRGIRSVEVRVDDGPWNPAELATEYSTDTWRQWTWIWDATPGRHTLYCRATDATGATQPEERVPPIPEGATGWHSRAVTIE